MVKKIKKVIDTKKKDSKEPEKDSEEGETEKEGGTLSDGVLDAFDEEVAAVDPLEDDSLSEDDEDDSSGDDNEWQLEQIQEKYSPIRKANLAVSNKYYS